MARKSLRYVGAKPAKALQSLFETLSTGGVPGPAALAIQDRIIRVGAGLVVAWIGWTSEFKLAFVHCRRRADIQRHL